MLAQGVAAGQSPVAAATVKDRACGTPVFNVSLTFPELPTATRSWCARFQQVLAMVSKAGLAGTEVGRPRAPIHVSSADRITTSARGRDADLSVGARGPLATYG